MSKICINSDYCKGCLICVACCPQNVLQASSNINAKGYTLPEAKDPDACTECRMCEIVCPDLAIAVEITNKVNIKKLNFRSSKI